MSYRQLLAHAVESDAVACLVVALEVGCGAVGEYDDVVCDSVLDGVKRV